MPSRKTSSVHRAEAPLQFRATVEGHGMIRPGEKILAAVSGGGDSMGMLELLLGHRSRCPFTVAVAHVNHGLRGEESEEDQRFVERFAASRGLEFLARRVDVSRGQGESSSVEARARDERRRALLELSSGSGCAKIALGHNQDDQVETILMWLLRGTGRAGLAGMEPVSRDGIIRPVIDMRRNEIRDYLARAGIPYREDATNRDLDRTRNMLRLEIVPYLEERFPGCSNRLASEAGILSAEDAFLDAAAEALVDPAAPGLAAGRLAAAPPALGRRAVRLEAGRAGLDPRALAGTHIARILEMARSNEAGPLDLPGGYLVKCRAGRVLFERRERSKA